MGKKVVNLVAFICLMIIFALPAYANSCQINPSEQFKVTFSIQTSNLGESLYGVKAVGNNNSSIPIWTNDDSVPDTIDGAPFVRDPNYMALGGSYWVELLFYPATSGSSVGWFEYYVDDGNGFKFLGSYDADLKGIHPQKVLLSGDGTSSLNCSQSVTPPPTPLPDLCDYFPESLQTNRYLNSGFGWEQWDGYLNISGGSGEGNRIYLDEFNRSQALAFASSQVNGNSNNGCLYNDGVNAGNVCTVDRTRSLFPSGPPQPSAFDYDGSDVTAPNGGNVVLSPGLYNSLSFGINGSSITLEAGEYWVKALNFNNNDIALYVRGKVVLHYNQINFSQNSRVYINASTSEVDDTSFDHNNLSLIGHGNLSQFYPQRGSDIRISASIYISPQASAGFDVNVVDRFQMQGSITAPVINFRATDKSYIKAKSANGCYLPPQPSVDRIEIKPYNYHLTCETSPQDIVEVHVLDRDGNLVSGFQPSLQQASGSNLTIRPVVGESGMSNGIAQFQVRTSTPNVLGDYTLAAQLSSDGNTYTDTDVIRYVPYRFRVEDQFVVAGKNHSVPIGVEACDGGNLITLGYAGNPTASFVYQRPLNAPIDSNDFAFSAAINNNNRSAQMNFKESGQIRVTLEDTNFDCSDQERCPTPGGALKGEFEVYSRPWKIALCDIVDLTGAIINPATTTASPGFISAGSEFDVTYRPIVHSDSSNGASDQCTYPVTGNYPLDNGPISVSNSVFYPTSGDNGVLTPNVGNFSASDGESKTVRHSWSQVGTLQIETGATYLNMSLDPFTQSVGRFYPDYFKIDQNAWNDPALATGNQNFTYMNQPFASVTARVGAYNRQGVEATNYGLFGSNLQAVFAFDNQDRLLNADVTKLAAKSSYQGHQWRLDSDEIVWQKRADLAPDGPYNYLAGAALNVSLNVFPATVNDPVRFKLAASDTEASDNQVLPDDQPRLVFGRYHLSDVGGVEGTPLTVPLLVEYWNGSRFATNTNDSFSAFDGQHFCRQVLWPTTGAIEDNVRLSDTGVVASGLSSALRARQTTSTREQVRLWLRLDSSASSASCSGSNNGQAWLMYNWDPTQSGEENPAAVVTFGIFRGNDRVIFRGEPGLTGQ
ncbi:DUF6701 domain-containing protein [Vibrio sinaloensis]|uniref:DUF6701 domain-containing protein n=1 Tax=Photobacterium sp. (strain ATCC 43367) TaxID=379097 RepID=UPI002059DFC9|nr:DUF6701 domain-containing protein [Vibrio sinaloensis]UPQ88303.1 MSHA biogenesis protein MshQ [Vibrio sinaloensis]